MIGDNQKKVAVSFIDQFGNYNLAPFNSNKRREWKTKTGADKALDRLRKNNPTGARILHVIGVRQLFVF